MSFKSLNFSIQKWEERPELRQLQQFRQIVTNWKDTVGVPVAKHSRPHSLNRGILFVATSSSTWAQNLTLQRHRIISKLNPLLYEPLADIRFSTAQWQNKLADEEDKSPSLPSIEIQPDKLALTLPEDVDPVAAFQKLAEVIQKRSLNLPLCPQCQCPAPIVEIERWGICSLCRIEQLKS